MISNYNLCTYAHTHCGNQEYASLHRRYGGVQQLRHALRYAARAVAAHCNTPKHTATHCNAMQHTATYCNILQPTATCCNTLQHAATHCNTLQHTAAYSNTRQSNATRAPRFQVCIACVYNTLHHTTPLYPTLHHTAASAPCFQVFKTHKFCPRVSFHIHRVLPDFSTLHYLLFSPRITPKRTDSHLYWKTPFWGSGDCGVAIRI